MHSPRAGSRNPNGRIFVGTGEGEIAPPSVAVAEVSPDGQAPRRVARRTRRRSQPGSTRMEPEIIMVVLATFVGGGAMGATGMLLCQWVVRKMSPPPQHRSPLMDARDVDALKADVADLALRLHSVDARLDFTEDLLGGALSGARPPESLPTAQAQPVQAEPHAVAPSAEEEATRDEEASGGQEASGEEEASPETEASGETESARAIRDSSEREDAFGA